MIDSMYQTWVTVGDHKVAISEDEECFEIENLVLSRKKAYVPLGE